MAAGGAALVAHQKIVRKILQLLADVAAEASTQTIVRSRLLQC